MATPTFLAGTTVNSTNTATLSVSPSSGSLLVVVVKVHSYPSSSPSISTKTWNGNDLGAARKSQQGSGALYLLTNIYAYEVATGATANIVIVGGGTYSQISVTAYQVTGYNTGAIIGATAGESDSDATHVFTGGSALATAVGDVVIDGIIGDQQSTDRWLEVNSGTTSGYNSDPRPGNIGKQKAASGYVIAAGSTVDIGWLGRGFDSGPIPDLFETAHAAIVIQTAAAGAAITAANTLGAATSAATVKGRAGITSAKTLGTLTSAATAGGPRQITAAMTLGQLGSSASMLLINPSQANNTLGQLTSAATVKAIGTITSSKTLGSLTSVAGINVNTLSAANTLGALTSSASANGIASISSAKTLGTLTAAAFIAPNSIITGSPTLDAMVSQAVIAHGHVMRPTWTRKPSHSATWTRRA